MPENINRLLLKRLLHLFPAKIIKEYFLQEGTMEQMIENISVIDPETLINFACVNHAFTRQNIYLYTLNQNFQHRGALHNFPYIIENGNGRGTTENGKHSFYCLPETTFSVYLSDPTVTQEISFYQPVMIYVRNRNLVIQFTKLKKSVESYFPAERNPRKANESNTEENTLKNIIAYFSQNYEVVNTDLNKGIKHIWDRDEVDCYRVSYRDPHSVTLITMNKELTFKQQYAAKYLELVNEPIGEATWKYLINNEILCDTFICNPTNGTIGIGKSPKNINQIENVIAKILEHN